MGKNGISMVSCSLPRGGSRATPVMKSSSCRFSAGARLSTVPQKVSRKGLFTGATSSASSATRNTSRMSKSAATPLASRTPHNATLKSRAVKPISASTGGGKAVWNPLPSASNCHSLSAAKCARTTASSTYACLRPCMPAPACFLMRSGTASAASYSAESMASKSAPRMCVMPSTVETYEGSNSIKSGKLGCHDVWGCAHKRRRNSRGAIAKSM
mmetsp:Transcript_57626/g.115734  ORF Transcript_57626/g.115734 Transcript_57626/m.115734 type:complete len:214 (-) Transcript_57626:366-1007(-)